MSARDSRKYPEDDCEPHIVEVLTTAGKQPWHELALQLRNGGMTVRGIANELGLTFSRVQRFLNPESKAKAKAKQNKNDKERYKNDPEYHAKMKIYRRRYMQFKAPGRRKDVP